MDAHISVTPLFFKDNDIRQAFTGQNQIKQFRPYDICVACSEVIGSRNVDGAQQISGVWRIYLKTVVARCELLSKGFSLNNIHIQPLENNPRVTNSQDQNVTRILVKDLPLSLDNQLITDFLVHSECNLTSPLRYSFERNNSRQLTGFRNGDRYVYAVYPLSPALPRATTINGMRCRIFHQGQEEECKACRGKGHKTLAAECPARTDDQEVVAFRSYMNPLSNHYPTTIHFKDMDFKSVEHAFQYCKAMDTDHQDLAEEIKDSIHAGAAQRLAKRIPLEIARIWEDDAEYLMKELIVQKLHACSDFRDVLLDTSGTLAEATSDLLWASGLPPDLTMRTSQQYWQGKNQLGHILMELRDLIIDEGEHPEPVEHTVDETGDASDDAAMTTPATTTNDDDPQAVKQSAPAAALKTTSDELPTKMRPPGPDAVAGTSSGSTSVATSLRMRTSNVEKKAPSSLKALLHRISPKNKQQTLQQFLSKAPPSPSTKRAASASPEDTDSKSKTSKKGAKIKKT